MITSSKLPPNPSAVHSHGSRAGISPPSACRPRRGRPQPGSRRRRRSHTASERRQGAAPSAQAAPQPSLRATWHHCTARIERACAEEGRQHREQHSERRRPKRARKTAQTTNCVNNSHPYSHSHTHTPDRRCGGGKIAGGHWPIAARKPGVPRHSSTAIASAGGTASSLARARDASARPPCARTRRAAVTAAAVPGRHYVQAP
jgi:hypothetical protein